MDPFTLAAGWLQEHLLVPALYALDLMDWEDVAFGWAIFAIYGVVQVAVTYAVCLPLERLRPLQVWPDRHAVGVDVLYTLVSRVGVFPLVTFVLFYQLQVSLNGFLTDHGWVPPTLERLVPALLGHPVLTFACYLLILDCADYWRHRLSHRFGWWWALHSLHHAQEQMTFWWVWRVVRGWRYAGLAMWCGRGWRGHRLHRSAFLQELGARRNNAVTPAGGRKARGTGCQGARPD